ncbi:Chromo domain/shadow [Penicillium psychrosexuale]|uniref:Chromo domain/shadow n=1 Tax=Penicillium psychrosexuale TaxID=1002107 RepID=UPI00254502EE|nr:Chromo domain/shadow [Penicillium psychrosexuale]KAJ5790890.1 Chromo domain/shadow [Penicillium psychrosexuale]
MASDSEMNDASGVGDADSLASTAQSEEEAEYFVNDIHAERRFYVEPDSEDDEGIFITQYLVEWAGYSMDRCSWEPKEMFTSEETLDGWEEKKKQIAEGKVTPFNLKSWEKHMKLLEKKTEKRKEERRRKREQRARQKSLPQAESSRLANPDIIDAHEPEPPISSHGAPNRLSVDSTASSALFVPAETPPPSKKVARQSLLQTAPPTGTTPRNEPPKPRTSIAQTETTSSKLPNSRLSQLAKRITAKYKLPARQKSPPQAAKPILSSFATGPGAKRAYRDKKWGERPPDLSQMELMKPSEFPPRMNIGSTISVVGPSVTSPKSLEAQNQSASENSVGLTGLLKTHTGQIDDKAAKQPQKHVLLAHSSAMAPPVSRSSNLGSTGSVSSSGLDPERPIGSLDSLPPSTQSKPIPQTNLTYPGSVDSIASTSSSPGEAPLTNPVGRSTSALTAPSLAPRPSPQANINTSTCPPASTGSVLPPVILSGGRAEALSSVIALSMVTALSTATVTTISQVTVTALSVVTVTTLSAITVTALSTATVTTISQVTVTALSVVTVTTLSAITVIALSMVTVTISQVTITTLSAITVTAPRPSPSHYRLASKSSNSTELDENPSVNAPALVPTGPKARPSAQPSLSIAPLIPTGPKARPPAQPGLSIAPLAPRMPVRAYRPSTCIKIGKYWCVKGDALVNMFMGPDRKFLGAFRLCGIRTDIQKSLVMTKNPKTKQVEVWFRHLCTVGEYERLCESSATNSVLSTGWVEGFSDTNENLFHLAENLRKDDLIAIHYPPRRRNGNGPAIVLVSWSYGSQEFKFPHPDDEVPPGIPLLVAARTMLAPIEVLWSNGPDQPHERPHGFLPNTSLSLRVKAPRDDGLESGSPPRRSDFHRDITMSGSVHSRETLAPALPQSLPPASELKDNSMCAIPHPQDDQAARAVQAVEDFMKAHKINVEELATIEEGGKLSKADIFYLHFPLGNEEIQKELQLLQVHLKYHEKILFTSNSPGDWAKFVHNSRQGVAIFHESFVGYDTLQPPLNSVLPAHSFNFWMVRIQRPLELVDPRYCSPSDHRLRIFPYGGVILLTEDVLTDLKGVAVTLQWIRNANKHKRKSWTLMFPPRILEWIEMRLGNENHSQDHGLLLLIYTLIIKNNVTDPRAALFDKASLHHNSRSNVIAPSLDEYGTRTEHHDLRIKDKVERDADHLIEFFAGWSLINIPRFRNFVAVTSLSAPTGARWDKWGHMTVMRGGFGHFFKRFKIDSLTLMAYLSGPKLQPSSQATTPVAMSTPQTPNWTSHNSNASIQSTLTGSNGNGTKKYPAPYK